ncbi:primosomal protein DnaI [Hutsoniella sourekii]|uniref:primosomal protein DnaI n=1 Tax=Hutsoniella sourekii TaxID=87650 RepID=UPI000481F9AD|nr:primosomal protein DnaI [Hutsoniella sourekii]
MQSIRQVMDKFMQDHYNEADYQDTLAKIMTYPEIQSFIHDHQDQISQEMIANSRSKLNEYRREMERIKAGKPGQNPGFAPVLFINGNYIDVSYQPTPQYLIHEKTRKRDALIDNRMMSKDVRQASFDSFYTQSKFRPFLLQQALDWLDAYQENPYDVQAFYLTGPFGVGKTYLLGAMANQLADLGYEVTMVHYPSFTSEVKQNIQSGQYKEMIDAVKKVPVLILDDLGAEANTVWVRDEVLTIILEYRMKESLATFFSSNKTMNELAQHLASTRDGGMETVKADRIMERIRYLAREINFQGENLRQRGRR